MVRPSKSRLTAKVHHFRLKAIIPLAFRRELAAMAGRNDRVAAEAEMRHRPMPADRYRK
jgi:hypothetical protein